MRRTLHLVRGDAGPPGRRPGDWVVYLRPPTLAADGAPPLPPGPLDHAQLLALIFAADRVITW